MEAVFLCGDSSAIPPHAPTKLGPYRAIPPISLTQDLFALTLFSKVELLVRLPRPKAKSRLYSNADLCQRSSSGRGSPQSPYGQKCPESSDGIGKAVQPCTARGHPCAPTGHTAKHDSTKPGRLAKMGGFREARGQEVGGTQPNFFP